MNKKNVNFIADAIHSLTEGMKELTEKVEELKNSIDGGGVFQPDDGEVYWFISDAGGTFDSQWVDWVDTRIDEGRYAIGNCYSTRQSAEDAVRALKLIQKARESQNGFVPDWENMEQTKRTLHFDGEGIRVRIYTLWNTASIFGYWEERLMCEQFIDENQDDLIWFFTEYRR